MWNIQIRWAGTWVTVQIGLASRSDAEWAIGKWKQANNCTGDPFRAQLAEEFDPAVVPLGVDEAASMPATDELPAQKGGM